MQTNPFQYEIMDVHARSSLSYRELARIIDVDPSYIARIMTGERVPSRDVLISLCAFGWRVDRDETDYILGLAKYPPLGRTVRREFKSDLLTELDGS